SAELREWVGFDGDVVRAGQPLASEAVGKNRDRAVIFGARRALRPQFAGDEPTLPVARIAVRVFRRLAKDADPAGLLFPLYEPVVRDVAEDEITTVTEPHRPLGKAAAAGDALDGGNADHQRLETWVEHLDARVARAHR